MGQRAAARPKKEDDQNVCLINFFFCFISIYFYVFSFSKTTGGVEAVKT